MLFGAAFLLRQSAAGTTVARREDSPASQSASETAAPQAWGDTLLRDGAAYRRNTALKTILLLGIDQSEEDRTYLLGGGGHSDAIMLLILDEDSQTMKLLEISRDSMVDVDVYNQRDEYLYTGQMQLTLQYSVGSSMSRSNWLMKNKVSELLCGVPVDFALSLAMDGIAPAVDALGGITLTFEEDYTEIDPAFEQGAEVLLDGALAYKFVHDRDIEVLGSNDDRMERHAQVLRAIAGQMACVTTDQIDQLMDAAGPYLETDLDLDTLYALRSYTLDEELLKAPGGTQAGKAHDEYYLDEGALQAMVLELFYREETPS